MCVTGYMAKQEAYVKSQFSKDLLKRYKQKIPHTEDKASLDQ